MSEAADAARGVVASKGIPIGVTDGSTRYFNIGTTSDLRGQQPVTLGDRGQSQGFLYEQGGELKLGSTTPQWDTWVICNNATLKHPQLSWVGVVQGVVELPGLTDCSAVRLFAEDPANPTQHMGTRYELSMHVVQGASNAIVQTLPSFCINGHVHTSGGRYFEVINLSRLVLNYKGISHTTQWLEYPNIAPHLKSLSIPPNKPGTSLIPAEYTVPTIRLPRDDGGRYIMDSAVIAHELEKLYSDPPLHLNTPQQSRIEELFPALLKSLGRVLSVRLAENVLDGESVAYFVESRGKAFGFKLGNVDQKEMDEAWMEARPAVKELAGVLREGREGEGPFVREKEICYADVVLVAAMQFLKVCGGDLYERFVEVDDAFGRLFEAAAQWLRVDK
ncbi:MAG: hypothetical protein Q9222_002099 [Ikaeria aurantiellina]